jgi:transcriptional regulator
MTNRFDVSTDHDAVRMLVEHAPLAWVLASDGYTGSQLPLLGEYGPSGELIGLIGHFAMANPLAAAFAANPLATILFNGPQGYVSPRVAGKSNWAPTWNHAHLRIRASVKIDPHFTQIAVSMLVDWMEASNLQPWTERELNERYGMLMGRIVGFKAQILDLNARFKLAQDEHPDVLSSILEHHPDEALAQWMRMFNKQRLDREVPSDAE